MAAKIEYFCPRWYRTSIDMHTRPPPEVEHQDRWLITAEPQLKKNDVDGREIREVIGRFS